MYKKWDSKSLMNLEMMKPQVSIIKNGKNGIKRAISRMLDFGWRQLFLQLKELGLNHFPIDLS